MNEIPVITGKFGDVVITGNTNNFYCIYSIP